MTPENKRNPMMQTLKRVIGFEAYQQKYFKNNFPSDRIGQAMSNGVNGVAQFLIPLTSEGLFKLGKEEETLFSRSPAAMLIAFLLDIGVNIGVVAMIASKEYESAILMRTSYNLGTGALSEKLERLTIRKK